ncbi:MAG: signal peptidase I [Candidatus Portnoybacteria bacterium]
MKKALSFVWEVVKIVVISLAIILPVRYYLIQPFFVRGASMEPNFDNGQYLIINEIGYRLEEPGRSEVIVFRYPLDPSQYYIKRIIGLPNETVEVKDGRVFINNSILDESSYLPKETFTQGDTRVKLGEGEYFVLGDNRKASSDSRQWGALPQTNVTGQVWIRAWPFDQAKIY